MDSLISSIENLQINYELKPIIKLQALFRGALYRKKNIPNVFRVINNILKENKILFTDGNDGRTNSIIDEKYVLDILKTKLKNRIKISKDRHWHDFYVIDNGIKYPVNLKITNCKSADNVGNFALCVYAYTDHQMDLEQSYNNGAMSKILIEKLKNKRLNYCLSRDYFFVVINKSNNDIIINSMKSLDHLTYNINNLPFQIRWDKNTNYNPKRINKVVKSFVELFSREIIYWKKYFIDNITNCYE